MAFEPGAPDPLLIQKNHPKMGGFLYGAPGEIRTPDRPVRSRVLYPAELRAHKRRRIICIVGLEIKLLI